MPENNPHPLRKPLLITEFSSLAVLLVSMAWLGNQSTAENPLNPAWLLLPAVASLGVFLSFIGLMYLRWVASAGDEGKPRHKLIFALLALSLLGIWIYSIANTWMSMTGAT
ncbi:hypothetical protein [Marinobacter sp.]|uniref:hypothetical protein n=1 Tax=Marinobacter sp. TaxID=50741 RepID=UPI0019DBFA35|nr:hypothetical protein [Marinobacter sp.]MBE0486523.1 hypothetical protein [Marinobacter sp.]